MHCVRIYPRLQQCNPPVAAVSGSTATVASGCDTSSSWPTDTASVVNIPIPAPVDRQCRQNADSQQGSTLDQHIAPVSLQLGSLCGRVVASKGLLVFIGPYRVDNEQCKCCREAHETAGMHCQPIIGLCAVGLLYRLELLILLPLYAM
jgi:hypothetical protein